MRASKRLRPVQRYVELKEDQSAKALGEFLRRLEVQKKRLNDLELYRDEYHRRFQESAALGVPVRKLQDFRSFMHNLDRAIEQQVLLVRQIEVECEAKKRQWLAAHQRTQIIDTVVEQHKVRENHQEEKRDQRTMDDNSARKTNK